MSFKRKPEKYYEISSRQQRVITSRTTKGTVVKLRVKFNPEQATKAHRGVKYVYNTGCPG
jgi:hypothetical protein